MTYVFNVRCEINSDVTKKGNATGKEHREREKQMKLLIGLWFNLGFVPILHFPISRFRYPFPVAFLVTSSEFTCKLTGRDKLVIVVAGH